MLKLPRWLDLGRYLREQARRAEIWPLDADSVFVVSDGSVEYRIQGQDHAVRLSYMLNVGARYPFRIEPDAPGWWRVVSEWERYVVEGPRERAEQMVRRLSVGGGNFLVEREEARGEQGKRKPD